MNPRRTVLAGAVLITILTACSGGGSAASVTAPPEADLTITAEGMAFDRSEITAAAGEPFELFFRNLAGVPHNVAIYTDASASEPIFVGETISDAATVYEVAALEPDEYFFRCDLHPDMTGTLVVED